MNPSPEPEYTVPISGAIRDLLFRLHASAVQAGRRAEYLRALKAITVRLRTDPVNFGEELFDLKGLRTTIKVGVVLPLAVEFAVLPEQRVVFVRTVRLIEAGS